MTKIRILRNIIVISFDHANYSSCLSIQIDRILKVISTPDFTNVQAIDSIEFLIKEFIIDERVKNDKIKGVI